MSSDDDETTLTAAAERLETDLARLEEIVKETARVEVSSDKSLQRARRLLEQCSEQQLKLAEHLKSLVIAMNGAQGRVQASLEETLSLSRQIGTRAAERSALVERFAVLGQRTREINAPVAAVVSKHQDGALPGELLAAVGEILSIADGLVSESDSIAKDARTSKWVDIGREADALRQQILSARNKLLVLQRGLSERAPS